MTDKEMQFRALSSKLAGYLQGIVKYNSGCTDHDKIALLNFLINSYKEITEDYDDLYQRWIAEWEEMKEKLSKSKSDGVIT